MIDKKSCGYEPRLPFTRKGKVNQRAKRIKWEHLIPVILDDNLNAGEKVILNALPPKENLLKEEGAVQR